MTDGKNGKPLTERLKDLPSAQPERKTGWWIKLYPRAYKCSECKTWWEESEDDEIKEFTYCPNCGVKMIGVKDND